MNSCAYYQELISTLVDGELSDEESKALMLHLNSCSRCNAMYAVFHDLSDILSEDPEPLPEGLHENIMAGVRRSELLKKNRRMRRIGLRTAMTAAACAVLVLFAAAGFGPGMRGDNVSVRSAEEAQELIQAPAPVESPSPDIYAAPAMTSAPAWTQAPAPAQTAPVQTDAYYTTGGSNATYTPVQPEQSNYYSEQSNYYSEQPNFNPDYYSFEETNQSSFRPAEPIQPETPVQTPTSVQPAAPVWTPESAYEPSVVTTAAPVQTSAPAQAPAPIQAEAPVQSPTSAQTPMPALIQQAAPTEQNTAKTIPTAVEPAAEPAVETMPAEEAADISVSPVQAPAAAQDTGSTASFMLSAAETVDPAENKREPESNMEQESEESPTVFSFFSSMINKFDAAPAEQLAESKLAAPAVIDAALDELSSDEPGGISSPVLSSIPLETPSEDGLVPFAAETPAPSVSEERFSVYGSEARSRLLAMIGTQEDSLPQEAELTRLVHVSLVPDDAYGSEETIDISIYGDFVYCRLHPVEGGSVTYRADCSLKELDSFLADCMAAPEPSAAPTPDPYTVETSVPTAEPSPGETPLPTTAAEEDIQKEQE